MAEFTRSRKRGCLLCEYKINYVDYKDERFLRRFINERGKIVPRRISGNTAMHQRMISTAIKRARFMAILPYTNEIYK